MCAWFGDGIYSVRCRRYTAAAGGGMPGVHLPPPGRSCLPFVTGLMFLSIFVWVMYVPSFSVMTAPRRAPLRISCALSYSSFNSNHIYLISIDDYPYLSTVGTPLATPPLAGATGAWTFTCLRHYVLTGSPPEWAFFVSPAGTALNICFHTRATALHYRPVTRLLPLLFALHGYIPVPTHRLPSPYTPPAFSHHHPPAAFLPSGGLDVAAVASDRRLYYGRLWLVLSHGDSQYNALLLSMRQTRGSRRRGVCHLCLYGGKMTDGRGIASADGGTVGGASRISTPPRAHCTSAWITGGGAGVGMTGTVTLVTFDKDSDERGRD